MSKAETVDSCVLWAVFSYVCVVLVVLMFFFNVFFSGFGALLGFV